MSQKIISIDTDTGLTVIGIIRQENNSSVVWNGSALETYSDAHWSTYKLSTVEQGTSGHYVLTSPSGLPSGFYVITFYQDVGGLPTDPQLGTHNFELGPTIISGSDLDDLVDSLRTLANDTDASNAIYGETPVGSADASNVYFRLQNKNVVSSSVYITNGTSFRSQSGFNVDLDNAIITFASAPASGSELLIDYNFNWFTDDEYAEFLNEAARHLGQSDPTEVADGLRSALLQYSLGYCWQRRSATYAHRYSSSSMGVSAQVDVITKNFMALAKAAFDSGDRFRSMYYKRQGEREAPASGTVTYNIDPYTPQR